MRILLVNDYAAPFGGAEARMLELAEALRECGHDVRLLASSAGLAPGVESGADYLCAGTTSSLRTLVQTANPSAMRRMRQALAEFAPDVVHVKLFLTQLSPLVLAPLQHVPALLHVVWYRPICPIGTKLLPNGLVCRVPPGAVCYRGGCLPLRDWLPLMAQMRLWRRRRRVFDRVIANSAHLAERLESEGIAPVEVVPNGFRVSNPPPRPPAEPPTVVFAGRLVREKGVDVLLRAFALMAATVPTARLVVAGDGPARRELEQLRDDLRLTDSVEFTGYLLPSELERRFASAWVQAVPSRWEEPFGNVAVEAQLRATPVVASATGGLREIVRDGESGVLVPRGEVAPLAEALLALLRDRERSERLARRGRELAIARYSLAAHVDRLLAIYGDLAAAG